MQDIKQSSPPSYQQPSVAANHEDPTVVSFSEVPATVVSCSRVPAAVSAYSEDPTVAAFSEVPSRARTNPMPTVRSAPPVLFSKVKLQVLASQAARGPIPAPSVPKPVPTRTFAKAISARRSQLLSRPRTITGGSKEAVETKHTNHCYQVGSEWQGHRGQRGGGGGHGRLN